MSQSAKTSDGDNLRSLIFSYENGRGASLSVLDQLLLPHETKYVAILTLEHAWDAIRSMRIRGAPLIAIVAVLGLAVDLTTNSTTLSELDGIAWQEVEEIKKYVFQKMDYLKTSRPTAVNLFNAMVELKGVVDSPNNSSREAIVNAIVSHAQFMLERDVSDNKSIGQHGADDLLHRHTHPDGVRVVTICNTGSLATAGWGTALGVVRELQRRGKLRSIAALETRPYNQGSRLTAYEIMMENMRNPFLICDSMAASYMRAKGADVCVVGADRVCANGDTANKIGTFQLAIIAKEMGVDFFVASPFTTLDVDLENGDMIEIEERPAGEMLDSSFAPKGMPCWNPSFDVTPADYITGIITEKGVLRKGSDGKFDVKRFVVKHS